MLTEVLIKKFRGFQNVSFHVGSQLTVIAGQNGTQKTTLLGMMTQMFTIPVEHPFRKEKPLCGGSYISDFTNKFKFSPNFDIAGQHEWTLRFDNREDFVATSIWRDKDKKTLRFWKKGSHDKGSGYIPLPVIYLSLRRLFPIGEDAKVDISNDIELTDKEKAEYKYIHDDILFNVFEGGMPLVVKGSEKQTIGVNTENYDWRTNSAGQDNLGKIVLALFSFKRLKETYQNEYKGGILAIDELDSTLFPASQVKILKLLCSWASKYNIQIVFTTHSLSLLEEVCKLQEECSKSPARKQHVNVVSLRRMDNHIQIRENILYGTIKSNLCLILQPRAKTTIDVYTEDNEARLFVKALLPANIKRILKFSKADVGCAEYGNLIEAKVAAFLPPKGLVILDGDVKTKFHHYDKIKNKVILLPGDTALEIFIANWLNSLSDENPFWTSINMGYNKQMCFDGFHSVDFNNLTKAKDWFQRQLKSEVWGTTGSKMFRYWKKTHADEAHKFAEEIEEKVLKIIKMRHMRKEDFGL